jgi:hypothetical protein
MRTSPRRAAMAQLALTFYFHHAGWEDPPAPRACWQCGRRRAPNARYAACRGCGADRHPPGVRRFYTVRIVRELVVGGETFAIAEYVTGGQVAPAGVQDSTGKLGRGTPCHLCGRTIPLGERCYVTERGTSCDPSCEADS